MPSKLNVCDVICNTLSQCGVDHLFGLPGTQNVSFIESVRRSKLKMILPTHELAASFMACGYYRATMKPAVIVTIPGPGFTYALTGIAEAKHDSSACILLTIRSIDSNSRPFALQEIDQPAIAKPLVKKSFLIDNTETVSTVIKSAIVTATTGEPGPVMVEIDSNILDSQAVASDINFESDESIKNPNIAVVASRLAQSSKPIFIIGQGASMASQQLLELINMFGAAVILTSSGRGTISDLEQSVVCNDISNGDSNLLNRLFEKSDLIIGFGCKFSHNGSAGFKIIIEKEKFIHIDQSKDVLQANYPASIAIQADVSQFVRELRHNVTENNPQRGWSIDELKQMRHDRLKSTAIKNQPLISGPESDSWSRFFTEIYKAYPSDTILVTDSGMHQMLARAYATITAPRSLITPSDFQSMGFGLPAAIGAAFGEPSKQVVLIIGDGGFNMSAMETLTAKKENLSLTIVILADKKLGLIRNQQLRDYGREFSVDVENPNYTSLADALGASYYLFEGNAQVIFEKCASFPGLKIIEIPLSDSDDLQKTKFTRLVKETVRKIVPDNLLDSLKKK